MAEYELPAGPAGLLEAVREALGEHLGGEHYMRLGGGTALAMRWGHRHSTDVDLFTDSESYERLWKRRDAFRDAVAQRVRPRELSVRRWNAKIVLQEGEITLFTSLPLTDQPRSADTVRGTSVPLETNAEILAKKLSGRMLDTGQLLARDLYDFAVARHHDPAAVQNAIKNIDVSDLKQLKRELDVLPEDWVRSPRQRPLIRPTHPAEAANPAPFVGDQILREILARTPPRPHRSPPGWER